MLINIVIAGAKYNALPLSPPSLISSHFPGLLSLVFTRDQTKIACRACLSVGLCTLLYAIDTEEKHNLHPLNDVQCSKKVSVTVAMSAPVARQEFAAFTFH